jgi:integrase/recombinase XerC
MNRSANQALTDWLAYLAQERRSSPRTVRAYGDCVGAYLSFLKQHRGGALSLEDMGGVEPSELRAYLAFRRSGDHPLSPRSVSQALSAIRTFHKWLDRRCGVVNAALALVRGPRVRPGAPRPVSEDQARGLLQEASDDDAHDEWETARDEAVLTLLYGCGLRISEALSLKRSDAPLRESIRIVGKGSKERVAPLLPVVREAVDRYVALLPFVLEPHEPLFRAHRGGPLGPRPVQALMQKLRGHASLSTSQRYTAVDAAGLLSIYAKAHPRA